MHVASNSTQVTCTFLLPTPLHPTPPLHASYMNVITPHPTPPHPFPPSGNPRPQGCIYIYIYIYISWCDLVELSILPPGSVFIVCMCFKMWASSAARHVIRCCHYPFSYQLQVSYCFAIDQRYPPLHTPGHDRNVNMSLLSVP